jgi:hypothetical protein
MNTYDAASFIERKLPEAHVFEKSGRLTFDINKTIACLTQFLKNRFAIGDMLSVKTTLGIADIIYMKGDPVLRTAIENILVYSFSGIMPTEKWQRKEFKGIIPASLFVQYIHQITHIY